MFQLSGYLRAAGRFLSTNARLKLRNRRYYTLPSTRTANGFVAAPVHKLTSSDNVRCADGPVRGARHRAGQHTVDCVRGGTDSLEEFRARWAEEADGHRANEHSAFYEPFQQERALLCRKGKEEGRGAMTRSVREDIDNTVVGEGKLVLYYFH